MFLDDTQLVRLTGRRRKTRQIEWLRAEGIPFRVNATGHPVVTCAAVEGRAQPAPEQPRPKWKPRLVGA